MAFFRLKLWFIVNSFYILLYIVFITGNYLFIVFQLI